MDGYAGTIRGHVSDPHSGEALPGIVVEIKALNRATISGLDGSYLFRNIPQGAYTVTVNALSYAAFSGTVGVKGADATAVLDIALVVQHKRLQEVAVVGVRNAGTTDAGARQLEKIADNVLNILSTRQILLMPDVTVANVLRRMSGVTVDRGSSGEGRYPVIRGMDKRYNYTLINGIKIPSPDDKNRYVPMDLFPSEILQRLEVIKSLTPDMEGDAIGGVMNLVLKDAPERLMINAQGALGYSQQVLDQSFMSYDHGAVNPKSPGEIYGPGYVPTYSNFSYRNLVFTNGHPLPDGQLGLTVGNRWFDRKLGLIVSGSFQSTDRVTRDLFFSLSPQPDPIPGGTQPEITDEEPRTYSIHEDRLGAHAKLDYRLNAANRISLYAVLMQLNTYQTRYFSRLVGDAAECAGVGGSGL